MPAIHFRTTIDAEPDAVYHALATEEGSSCAASSNA